MTRGRKGLQDQRRAHRRRSCEGKIPYESREAAELGRRRAMRYFKTELHAYRCDFCGKFHLGH